MPDSDSYFFMCFVLIFYNLEQLHTKQYWTIRQYKLLVLIDIGNSRRIIANIVRYDNNFNMVLKNITEKWSEKCDRTGKWLQKERYLAKIFLPGDNIRIIAKL